MRSGDVGRTAALLLAVPLAVISLLAPLSADAAAATNRLSLGGQLNPGQQLTSSNGQYKLLMQTDGNLVLYTAGNTPLWSTQTPSSRNAFMRMQTDGNMVLYSATGAPLWNAWTDGGYKGASFVQLGDDGNLVMYTSAAQWRWQTKKPNFEVPFPCGQAWSHHTHDGHGGNLYPLDFNQGSGDSDLGRPVVASASGTVKSLGATAGVMVIEHGGGWTTEYRHMNEFKVGVGVKVLRGQQIGTVGKRDTEYAHLHYVQRKNGAAQHITFQLHQPVTYYNVSRTGINGPNITSNNCAR